MARLVAQNMSDILAGGDYVGVVNAPDLSAINKIPGVRQFVLLAEQIGSVQGQLLGPSRVNHVHISLNGPEVAADSRITEVVKTAVLKGVLGALHGDHVSYVSAASIAAEAGLSVSISLSKKANNDAGYSNTVGVELECEGFLNMTRTVEGTVLGDSDLRITQVDGFDVNIPTGNSVLIFNQNSDGPGIMRRLAEKISAMGINIATFSMGRKGSAANRKVSRQCYNALN